MRAKRRVAWVAAALIAITAAGLFVTRPSQVPRERFVARPASLANGELMFHVGGCMSCHGRKQDGRVTLGGGLGLRSPFGTFYAPNISPSPQGLAAWTEAQFADAMLKGTDAASRHLYPAFPYTSYRRMALDDVRDLYAYLRTLPPDVTPSRSHELPFPFNVRQGIGIWKLLFFDEGPFAPEAGRGAAYNRGAYLVEGPGHCAECHSTRNAFGAVRSETRYAGGPDAAGEGWVPNITPHPEGLESWSAADMEFFLESGAGPDGSAVTGEMGEVIDNLSKLSPDDRRAVAAFLRALPPRPGKKPAKAEVAK